MAAIETEANERAMRHDRNIPQKRAKAIDRNNTKERAKNKGELSMSDQEDEHYNETMQAAEHAIAQDMEQYELEVAKA